MTGWRLDMDAEARTVLRHMHPGRKQHVKDAMRSIGREPFSGKALQQELAGLHSFRVGTFRIVYEIDEPARAIRVVAIGPRREIYEELEAARRKGR